MTVLGFERCSRVVSGRRVRAARFERRSMLPVSAACVIANSVRQKLTELFGTAVRLRLLEPVLPDTEGWACICAGALIYAVDGKDSDAAFVLRRNDALALAGAILGERIDQSRALSAIEGRLIARMAVELSETLTVICGPHGRGISRIPSLGGYTTYFEMIVEAPVRSRIGVALSREPLPVAGPPLLPAHLREVELTLCVEAAHGFMPAASVAALQIGDVVPFDSRLGDEALVRSGEMLLARGECGEIEARRAVALR